MITFGLLRMIPGNVAVAVMGTNAYRDPGAIKVFNADYGFNLPWYRQYFLWLGTLTTVALFSRYMRSSVLDNLTEDYVRTARAKGASELRVLARHVLRNSMITIDVDDLLRDAGLPDRHRRNPAVRHRHPALSPGRPAGRGRGRDLHGLQRADPAGLLPVPDHHRAVQQVHAFLGAGQPHRGLRAHRPGQGRQRAAGAGPARAAQLDDHHSRRCSGCTCPRFSAAR